MWSWGLGLKRNRGDNIKTGTWWALCREGILVWGTRCRQVKRRGRVRGSRWFLECWPLVWFCKKCAGRRTRAWLRILWSDFWGSPWMAPGLSVPSHIGISVWQLWNHSSEEKLVSTVNTWPQGYIHENHQLWITACHEHTESDTWWQIMKLKIPSKLISIYSSCYEPV